MCLKPMCFEIRVFVKSKFGPLIFCSLFLQLRFVGYFKRVVYKLADFCLIIAAQRC